MSERARRITRWLRGDACVYSSGQYVRVWIERPGVTAEVYISRTRARELRDNLDSILAPPGASR